MVLESLHGLQATSITMNERFTKLAASSAFNLPQKQATNFTSLVQDSFVSHGKMMDIIKQRALLSNNRKVPVQHTQAGGMRRYRSEGNLSTIGRSNSYNNLNLVKYNKPSVWRQSNENLSPGPFRKWSQSPMYWRNRNYWFRTSFNGWNRQNWWQQRRRTFAQGRVQGRGRGRGRGRWRGRGRGGGARTQKPVPTKEELDAQLDAYMGDVKMCTV